MISFSVCGEAMSEDDMLAQNTNGYLVTIDLAQASQCMLASAPQVLPHISLGFA
jgi:hypothetical protein